MHSRRRQQVNRFTVPTPPPSTLPLPFPLYSNFPFSFLSSPPWRIPYNPPRDPPPFVLFSFFRSLVSFLPFADLLGINSPCRIGVPTIGPPVPLSILLHYTEGCDLCFPVATRSLPRRPVRRVCVHHDIRISFNPSHKSCCRREAAFNLMCLCLPRTFLLCDSFLECCLC